MEKGGIDHVQARLRSPDDGIGVWVVEFMVRSRTRVGGSKYLESTRELVWVRVLGVIGGESTCCRCRVWSSWGNGCGGKGGGNGTLGSIPRFGGTRNWTEGQERGIEIREWKV